MKTPGDGGEELMGKAFISYKGFSQRFLPKDGLYPLPLLRATVEKGTAILVLNGPKQRSVVPGAAMAMLGSMVALKATLTPSESKTER